MGNPIGDLLTLTYAPRLATEPLHRPRQHRTSPLSQDFGEEVLHGGGSRQGDVLRPVTRV
jgi:hypothetical protein